MRFILYSLVLILGFACKAQKPYPFFPNKVVHHTYHGKEIGNEYEQLENVKDSASKRWLELQDTYARQMLNLTGTKQKILGKMIANKPDRAQSYSGVRYADNGSVVFEQDRNKDEVDELYFKHHTTGEHRLLFDPAEYGDGTPDAPYHIDYKKISWDGHFVAVALKKQGDAYSKIIILETLTGKVLGDAITQCKSGKAFSLTWTPDSKAILYSYFPIVDKNHPDFDIENQTVLYRLGEDPNIRNVVFSSESHPKIKKGANTYAMVWDKSDEFAIGWIATVSDYADVYIAKVEDILSDRPQWEPLYTSEDQSILQLIKEDKIYFLSGKHPNRSICTTDFENPDYTNPNIFVPPFEDEVIKEVIGGGGHLYFSTLKNGIESSLYKVMDDGSFIKLDFGRKTGDLFLKTTSKDGYLYAGVDSWTDIYTLYAIKDDQVELDPMVSKRKYPLDPGMKAIEVEVPSHDGVMVPLSLIVKKGQDYDGSTPVLMHSYGAYGNSKVPYLSTIYMDWIIQGGIVAIPHIRGGGEKGDTWHKAGMKQNKVNSWRDIIASAQYLVDQKYTGKGKICLFTSSAGGIAGGMAVNERPDLFGAFVANKAVLNPQRMVLDKMSKSNYLEYGSMEDIEEADALVKMDPLINIKKQPYPAVLALTSFSDNRVPPWQMSKYIAKLQQNNTADTPVLIYLLDREGHSSALTASKTDDKYSTIFAFALDQMGCSVNKGQ